MIDMLASLYFLPLPNRRIRRHEILDFLVSNVIIIAVKVDIYHNISLIHPESARIRTRLSTLVHPRNLHEWTGRPYSARILDLDIGASYVELGIIYVGKDVLEAHEILSRWRCGRDGEIPLQIISSAQIHAGVIIAGKQITPNLRYQTDMFPT